MSKVRRLSKTLSLNLKELRRRRGFTQAVLAERAGLSTQTIAFIESGRNWPSMETIEAIARALRVPETALMQALDKLSHPPVNSADALAYLRDVLANKKLFQKLVDLIEAEEGSADAI